MEALHLLLAKGADVHIPNKISMTPLVLAGCHGCAEAVRLLLVCGASPNMKNKEACSNLWQRARALPSLAR